MYGGVRLAASKNGTIHAYLGLSRGCAFRAFVHTCARCAIIASSVRSSDVEINISYICCTPAVDNPYRWIEVVFGG